jgi:hypothetical protein
MQYSTRQRFPARRILLAAALLIAAPAAAFLATAAVAQAAGGAAASQARPAAATAGATESAPGVPQPARWTQKKLFFVYRGLQTNYSCDGLQDQIREVLLTLGARKSDLDLVQTGCTSGFKGVSGTFSVLEPVPPEQAYSPSASGSVAARWQPVQVQLDRPGKDVNAQCELLDQVKQRILPLFATRNIQYDSTCSPRQLIVGGTSLKLEVLSPEEGRVARE